VVERLLCKSKVLSLNPRKKGKIKVTGGQGLEPWVGMQELMHANQVAGGAGAQAG
jgi:hypothetical protein